jgi:DNA-binding PadR family transcriptional regulator
LPPSVAAELAEDGLLTIRPGDDGELVYSLTRKGVKLARELLEESPSARAYLARLRAEGRAR